MYSYKECIIIYVPTFNLERGVEIRVLETVPEGIDLIYNA
jgi:hypothetical protein